MTLRLDTLRRVETPEGVALTLRSAGIVPRFYAFCIDGAIRLALMLMAGWLLSGAGGVGVALWFISYFLISWLYPVAFELSARSATPGKRALHLRVVMDNGLPVTPAASLTRNLLRTADFLPLGYGLALLSMLLRSDFKRLGDLAAGTLVVHDESVRLHAPPPPQHAVPPARALKPDEQAAVVAWALRMPRLTPARADELAMIAAPAVAAGAPGASASEKLLGVAHWLMGKR